ncbi:amino acid-binding protein [Colwellia sp. 6M3]|jgi:glycine cleavage system regulatory protein|uniref:glycine cleavage system protein R n=1 Tax=Colwellia sp. 6M3 TaxID=2759849 RepID=UPI0015F5CDA9|nr:ACT domain-containing protein [Colwellia sp. 6M3]MBA6415903.1 amino acid-binding protein [Colwellia sp. 6M3]|tara:strand:- start:671 stop:1168 length:498 start_codon:yes stop_codon:yes gene_type:complete
MNHLIISFMTADRPGIVKVLSDLISEHKANWEKSSLHQISGVFAGVVEIAVPAENATELADKLAILPGFKMQIEHVQQEVSAPETILVLELTANDRAGIVQEISSTIHHHGGNLLKLVSTQEIAPHAGHELFKAKVTISVDKNTIDTMIDALENLADDLMVDISR